MHEERVNQLKITWLHLCVFLQDLDPNSFTRRVSFPKLEQRTPPQDVCHTPRQEMYYSFSEDDDESEDEEFDEEESQYNNYDQEVFNYGDGRRCPKTSNNPFAPATLVTKLTADRKRWTHIFPRGEFGVNFFLIHEFFHSGLNLMERNQKMCKLQCWTNFFAIKLTSYGKSIPHSPVTMWNNCVLCNLTPLAIEWWGGGEIQVCERL